MRRCLLALLLCLPFVTYAADDFTFWQFSDTHAPLSASGVTVAAAREVAATGIGDTGAPAFVLVTGDLTEFGLGEGGQALAKWFADWPVPIYMVPGNHDNTWWPARPMLQSSTHGLPWSFDHGGCHFVGLDSAGRDDPRPGFTVEELDWLAADLAKVGPATPVFVAFHHPLQGGEWSSPADYERLLAILAPYNVALMMVGHGHSAVHLKFGPYDAVEGGSTFDNGAKPASAGRSGFNIISVSNGQLRVAYHTTGVEQPDQVLLEKPLASTAPVVRPTVKLTAASESAATALPVALTAPVGASEVTVGLDNGEPTAVAADGTANLNLSDAVPGRHLVRARAKLGDEVLAGTSPLLITTAQGARELWRVQPGGSFRGTPALAGERLLVVSQGGRLTALNRATGETMWTAQLGNGVPAECYGGPLVVGPQVVVSSTSGYLEAFDVATGNRNWACPLGKALAATPTVAGDQIVVGTIEGDVHAVSLAGQPLWQRLKATDYSIETPIVYADGKLYLGAWDQQVRCLRADNGEQIWAAKGEGSRNQAAARYYSPGDAAPTVLGDRVFAADRNYDLIVLDAATGERAAALDGAVSTALTADGTGIWTKLIDKAGPSLARLDRDGKIVWRVPTMAGSLPSVPAEADGLVAVTSNAGIVSAHRASDGELLWRYQVNPGFWLPGGAVTAGGVVYTAGADGSVSAVVGPSAH